MAAEVQTGERDDRQASLRELETNALETLSSFLIEMNRLEREFDIDLLSPRAKYTLYALFMERSLRGIVTLSDLGGGKYNLGSKTIVRSCLSSLQRLSMVETVNSSVDARKNNLVLTYKANDFFMGLYEAASSMFSCSGERPSAIEGASAPRHKRQKSSTTR